MRFLHTPTHKYHHLPARLLRLVNTPPTIRLLAGEAPLTPFTFHPFRRFPVQCAVTLPNEQRIVVPDEVVRWSRCQEFVVENLAIWPHLLCRSRKVIVGQALSEDLSSVLHSLSPMAPTPQHSARKVSHSCSLLLALLCLAGTACGTIAPTGNILIDDPRGTVSLQTMSDRSIQANHPINLDPNLIAQLLRGIEIQEQEYGLQKLITRPSAPIPVFSDDQIRFLAPLLAEGLRTATPDQRIEYRVNPTHKGNAIESSTTETTAGSLYAYGRQLYVILSQYNYNQMRANMNVNDMSYQSRQPDSSGFQDYSLLFTPSAAQRSDSFDPPAGGKSTDRFIAVDYQLLQQASPH